MVIDGETYSETLDKLTHPIQAWHLASGAFQLYNNAHPDLQVIC